MEQYLDAILRPLLIEPDALAVTKTSDELGVLLTVDIAKADMGFIIGKEGQNIKKVRAMLALYGTKHQAKISLKVNEPVGGKYHGTTNN